MKRRARAAEAAKFSLFPFLAVLLCVMGALIVLLIVIAQRTHDRAAQQVAVDEEGNKLQAEREELSWRLEQVRASRDATATQLSHHRADLSHIEDHARRLREQYRSLEQAAKDLEQAMNAPSAESQELDAKIASVRRQIAAAEKDLEAKRLAPQESPGFAIIPYEGPNGTKRRPMYIECCDDGIILQPEGVVLTAEDFKGPLGPGNPLAAAMRAAREYLVRNQRMAGEPYPLLLIRPDGIGAYYVARESLTSWGSEFGYELVDQDWNLEYPAPDPQLMAVITAAAEDARQRQRMLAAAAPKAFAHAEESGGRDVEYRASPGLGGAIVDGGGMRRGGGSRGGGSDDDAFGGGNELSSGGFQRSGSRAPGAKQPGARQPDGEPSDGSPEMQLAARNAENKLGEKGEPLKPGQYVPKPKESLAARRGKDWGLKNQGPRAVPISRKIRVRCLNDRMEILTDDRGTRNTQTVMFGPRTEDSVEEFVSKVWTHMDRWGIAGENMYWKPQLQFDVAPDSRGRFEEVKTLLDGSGLDVTEKQPPKTAQRYNRPPSN